VPVLGLERHRHGISSSLNANSSISKSKIRLYGTV
jgi:hypothetical protein